MNLFLLITWSEILTDMYIYINKQMHLNFTEQEYTQMCNLQF